MINRIKTYVFETVAPNWRVFMRSRQPIAWAIAITIGIVVAFLVIGFRMAIGAVQYAWLGTMAEKVASTAAELPFWIVIAAPVIGGLIVGLFLHHLMPSKRAEGVADVIEARALNSAQISLTNTLGSAFVSAVSLGAGASAGREGPAVHLGAGFASLIGRFFDFPPATTRALLGCGVAAAVSASFNAPLAGALFALEVVLGHYALSAFIPIVISSVCATVVTRAYLGDFPAFIVPEYEITSYLEFPAFALLGVTCGLVAICFQFLIQTTDWSARQIDMPLWARPVLGGFLVGMIGVFFPQILGVGYEATDMAIKNQFPLILLLGLIVAKALATAITLASRFGGGVFSPALYLGAMTGAAYGLVATTVFPDISSSTGLYTIVGMGAVAAAILGAPISTTLIAFELTGGYQVTIALLFAVSLSTGLMQAVHGRSFFHWQLNSRGLFLREGPHKQIVETLKVSDFMTRLEFAEDEQPPQIDLGETFLLSRDSLATALRVFDHAGETRIAVVEKQQSSNVIGWAEQRDALNLFNDALIEAHVEQNR
jgi:CIC family chloride channel protein